MGIRESGGFLVGGGQNNCQTWHKVSPFSAVLLLRMQPMPYGDFFIWMGNSYHGAMVLQFPFLDDGKLYGWN
jgi:hypothetical protein